MLRKLLEVPTVAEFQFERNDADGTYVIVSGNVALENPYPFSDEYAAWDESSTDWLGVGTMSDEGLEGVLMDADEELGKALEALAGLRQMFEDFELGVPGVEGPSGSDVCDALYYLMGQVGLKVL